MRPLIMTVGKAKTVFPALAGEVDYYEERFSSQCYVEVVDGHVFRCPSISANLSSAPGGRVSRGGKVVALLEPTTAYAGWETGDINIEPGVYRQVYGGCPQQCESWRLIKEGGDTNV